MVPSNSPDEIAARVVTTPAVRGGQNPAKSTSANQLFDVRGPSLEGVAFLYLIGMPIVVQRGNALGRMIQNVPLDVLWYAKSSEPCVDGPTQIVG
jgi:hypothetical protein